VARTLVIGFGNDMRRDDGAGRIAAEKIAATYDDVDLLSLAQLTPETAEVIGDYEVVFFLDASVNAKRVEVSEVLPRSGCRSGSGRPMSHTLSPQQVLDLAVELYGTCPPRVLLVEFPVSDLEFGCELSPSTRKMIDEFVESFSAVRPREGGPAEVQAQAASVSPSPGRP